jgi:hypothetical protein
VDDAPEVHVEQPPFVCEGRLRQLSIHPDTGIVDPRIEAAELLDREVRDRIHGVRVGDIGGDVECTAAGASDSIDCREQVTFVARGEHHPGTGLSRHLGGRQSDPTGGAGNDHYLVRKRLEAEIHGGVRSNSDA